MSKNRKNRVAAPEIPVEQVVETQVVVEETAAFVPEIDEDELEFFVPKIDDDELPFGPDEEDEQPITTPTTEQSGQAPEAEPEQAEEDDKGYRVVGTAAIKDLKVGQMYKREDKKNCKVWTVMLKEEGKMLVSSSPKNIHNPRKEMDMEVVVIEFLS